MADRITSVVKRYIPNPTNFLNLDNVRETVKLQKFIETLRADIKAELLKFGPENFVDAVNRAKNIELAVNDQALTVNNVNQQSSSDILQRLERMEQNFAKISDSLSNLNNVSCHICGKNHLTTKCWNFPQTSNFSNVPRFNGGNSASRSGHNWSHPYSSRRFSRGPRRRWPHSNEINPITENTEFDNTPDFDNNDDNPNADLNESINF